jgi:hypothetical protein
MHARMHKKRDEIRYRIDPPAVGLGTVHPISVADRVLDFIGQAPGPENRVQPPGTQPEGLCLEWFTMAFRRVLWAGVHSQSAQKGQIRTDIEKTETVPIGFAGS